MSKTAEFFDQEIEPKAICGNCDYFDGGGLISQGEPVSNAGDCVCKASPFFTTDAANTCCHFFPCSTRWPDADHE